MFSVGYVSNISSIEMYTVGGKLHQFFCVISKKKIRPRDKYTNLLLPFYAVAYPQRVYGTWINEYYPGRIFDPPVLTRTYVWYDLGVLWQGKTQPKIIASLLSFGILS